MYKALDCLSRDMVNFGFSEKSLRLVSPPHFVYISKKMFLMLHINWWNFIPWLPLFLQILGSMHIAIVCFPGCDVINFEINFIFFYMTKKSRQNLNILRTKRAFKVKSKAFFINFKVLSNSKNCLRPESAPLNDFFYW